MWFKPYTLAEVDVLNINASLHLGMEFTQITDRSLSARMPVDDRTKQPMGLLHGGVSCVLSETIGSIASNLCIDPKTHFAVGVSIQAQHLRSMRSGWIIGTALAVNLGQTLHFWEIRIVDEADKLVCLSHLTTAIRERRDEK